jgi:glycosyltransferase involved in cell wall biosynthesis
MRIAISADPELPVPPPLYGGIERIIDLLAQGLVSRGHEVTLIAHPDSKSPGKLIPWPGSVSGSRWDTIRNAMKLAQIVSQGRFDLLHSFSRIAYMTPILANPIPKVMTYQRQITPRAVKAAHALAGKTLQFTACGAWMKRDVERFGTWHVVHNGVPLSVYDFKASVAADAPLVFLGRVEEIKGPHLAIEAALKTGLNLVIAGNIPSEHQAWFDAMIRPHIDDRQIRYIGPVNDAQKNELLGSARAFLMPILWDEPFGIVMTEALACGTPVIGLRRGAVGEVVRDGTTGFIRDTMPDLIDTIARIGEIDRRACRVSVEQNWSEDAIVEAYLGVYRSLLGAQPKGARAAGLEPAR